MIDELIDPYIRGLFGANAIRLPLNFIVQRVDENIVTGVFQTKLGNAMLFGSNKPHQLILGEAVIRPHIVAHSDHLVGCGISGICKSGFTDIAAWIKGGTLIGPSPETLAAELKKIKQE